MEFIAEAKYYFQTEMVHLQHEAENNCRSTGSLQRFVQTNYISELL